MGLNMKEKQAVTREYRPRYHQATKKEKKALLDEFIKLTGYHRKSAVRLLNATPVKQVLMYIDGKPVKVKPEKNGLPTGKGNASIPMMSSAASVWYGRSSGSSAGRYSPRLCGRCDT